MGGEMFRGGFRTLTNTPSLSVRRKTLVRSAHRHDCHFFKPPGQLWGTVVYLHGLGGDATYLTAFLRQHLLSAGFQVICVDLEGHGRHSAGLWRGRDEDDVAFCRDLLLFLTQEGVTSFHVVGYSLGGVMACQLAVCAQAAVAAGTTTSCVKRLSLLCVPWKLSGVSVRMAGELVMLTSGLFWQHLWQVGLKSTLPALGPFLRQRYPVRQSISSSVGYDSVAAWIASRPTEQWLKELRSPTLWVEGRYDALIPSLPHAVRKPCASSFERLKVPAGHLGVLLCREALEGTVRYLREGTVRRSRS